MRKGEAKEKLKRAKVSQRGSSVPRVRRLGKWGSDSVMGLGTPFIYRQKSVSWSCWGSEE